jgi:putative protease
MTHPTMNRKKPRLPELLAPAGSPEAFRAAVAAGADAVYLGGKQFGARAYAQNFTGPEIEEALAYAHARGVRVYVTVNTLVHDRELADLGEYLIWLFSIGADAVLVQDAGVAAIARQVVPGLPLHASTQMTIHNADGVRWAAEMGFSRVVLAREISLDELDAIAKTTEHANIGLEVFVHGALCYCYSGQCLLSSVIGGRSGNRGMCAQPCRKPYALVKGEPDEYGRPLRLQDVPLPERYLLSPKDLCTYPDLERLVHSPVVSLKIEGRMKSPEYVATVVSTYRKALDALTGCTGSLQEAEMQNLALAFNRGFTGGYLFGERNAALMGRDQPDNRGLLIGTVTGYTSGGEVTIRQKTPVNLSAGDGLVFRDPNHADRGFGFSLNTIPRIEQGVIILPSPRAVKHGALVFLTSSTALTARARRIIASPSPELRKPVPIDLAVRVGDDGIPVLDGVIDAGEGKKVPVSFTCSVRLSPARARPLTADQFEAQLRKTGGTTFTIRRFSLDYAGDMFAPVSALNRIRREFLADAEKTLIIASRPPAMAVEQAQTRWAAVAHRLRTQSPHKHENPVPTLKLSVYADCIDVIRAAAAAGCDRIYFEPENNADSSSCQCNSRAGSIEGQLMSALTICQQKNIPLVWKLPRITRMHELDAALALLPKLHSEGLNACMVESTGAAYAVRHAVPSIQIAGSVGLNIFNHIAVRELATQFSLLTISPELSRREIDELVRFARADGSDTILELIVQGSAEAMVSEDCLLKPLLKCRTGKRDEITSVGFFGIRDRSGRIFPVRTDAECRTHIFNAVETCLLDYLPSLMQMGIGMVAIDARGRTAAYVKKMVYTYRDAIQATQQDGSGIRGRLTQLKDSIKAFTLGGITTGHFVRGLKEA